MAGSASSCHSYRSETLRVSGLSTSQVSCNTKNKAALESISMYAARSAQRAAAVSATEEDRLHLTGPRDNGTPHRRLHLAENREQAHAALNKAKEHHNLMPASHVDAAVGHTAWCDLHSCSKLL